MKLKHLNPSGLPDWSKLFSQVVVAEGPALRLVATSGQVGVDEHQNVLGDGSISAQAEGAFGNLRLALASAGCSEADVVKLTIYVVGYEQEMAKVIQGMLRQQFGEGDLPACTLVGVQALGRPEFLIEVEALAISTVGKVA